MVKPPKVTGTVTAMPVGLAMGLGVSLLITVAGCCIITQLILSESIPRDSIGYTSLVTLLLSSILGTATSWGCIRHRRLLVCGVSGGLYFLALLAVNILFFGGVFDGILVTALVIAGGSMVIWLLGLRQPGRGKTRFKIPKG